VARGNGQDEGVPPVPEEVEVDNGASAGDSGRETPEEEKGLTPAATAEDDAAPSLEAFEALTRERDELKDQFLRKLADFSNFRKRVERERLQAGTDAVAAFVAGLLPTLDHLELALAQGGDEASLRQGVELTRRELLAYLESQGVRILDPTGDPFDPENQQALSHDEIPGVPEGTVVEVLRKGCSLEGRLVRPALVRVAKGETSGDSDDKVH
jgi:molecular chaperone GrpE